MKITVAVLSVIASATIAFASESPYGACAHLCWDEYQRLGETCGALDKTGIRNVRVDFSPEMIVQAGGYVFERYDEIMRVTKMHGLTVLPMFGYSVKGARPAWRHLDDMWIPFLTNTLVRYRGRFPAVEIWNEENAGFWDGNPNADEYAVLLKAAYKAVKAVDPEIKVLIGGLSHVPLPYIRRLYELGCRDSFDVMNVHPYVFPRPPELILEREISSLQSLMAEFGDAEKEIWITEIGWPTSRAGFDVPGLMAKAVSVAKPGLMYPRICYADIGPERGDVSPESVVSLLREEFPRAASIEHVTFGDLSSRGCLTNAYDVIVLPVAEAFDDSALDALDAFVTSGGVLVDFGSMPLSRKGRERLGIVLHSIWNDKRYPRNAVFRQEHVVVPGLIVPPQARPAYLFFDAPRGKGNSVVPLLKKRHGDVDLLPAVVCRYANRSGAVCLSGWFDNNVVTVSEELQADYAVRANLTAFALGVEKVFWYETASSEKSDRDQESHFGLFSRLLQPKKAAGAYAELIRMRPAGSVQVGGLEKTADATAFSTSWLRPDGKMVTASWGVERPVRYDVFTPRERLAFDVCVSQAGFEPDDVKEFTIRNPPCGTFVVQTIDPSVQYHAVLTGKLVNVKGELWKGDFSSIRKPADYRILCGGDMSNSDVILPRDYRGSACHSFVVRTNHLDIAERFMFTFFTWQRCGSKKGWAGVCHQDPAPLYGTDRTIDVRGGYHQSGDLRGWADGISMSLYSLLRWSDVRRPVWDEGEIDAEIRWGCDYFLKLVGPEGYAYDCQFAPIGWGPRDYYPQPAALAAQQNICALLARAARRFRHDAAYSRRLKETAERMWRDIETNPVYDRPYEPMVKDLPPGSQPASYYSQTCRGSSVSFAGRSLAALELYKTTGDSHYAELALDYGRRLLALQIKDGPLSGAYLNSEGSNELGFKDSSYGHRINGVHTMMDLYRAFGAEEFKAAHLRTCDLYVRMLDADPYGSVPALPKNAPDLIRGGADFAQTLSLLTVKPPYVDNVRKGTGTLQCCGMQMMLNEAIREFGRTDYRPYAARMRDWIYGANPGYVCYVTGLGFNHLRRNVFGQFFPSTPSIPGGVCHVLNGEYDLPSAGMALWAIASEGVK